MCGKGEVEDADTATQNQKDGEGNKYGSPKKYDPTFNGPINDRGCTDIICCILFLICVLGMAVVGFFAYSYGDPLLLLYPSDSAGNLCGHGEYLDKPNLFFFDLIDCAKVGPGIVTLGCPTKQVCVTDCPSEYWTWAVQYGKEQSAEKFSGILSTGFNTIRETGRAAMICDYGINPLDNAYASAAKLKELIDDDLCAGYYYPQKEVLGRCLPAIITEGIDTAQSLAEKVGNDNYTSDIVDSQNKTVTIESILDGSAFVTKLLQVRSYGEKVFSDVENSKWFILFGLGLSMIVCFLWIVLMRWLAGVIVWVTIALFFAIFGFASGYSYWTYYDLKNDVNNTNSWILTTDFTYYLTVKEVWLAFGCTSATIFIILLLIILFLRSRIMIAIALVKEGSRAIGMMMFTLLWPIWPFLLELSLVAYWGATCLYLASSTKQVYGVTNLTAIANDSYDYQATSTTTSNPVDLIPCDPNNQTTGGEICNFVKNEVLTYTIYLQFYMLFMFFWTMNWIIGMGQMVLAGAFASYYWAFDKNEHMPTFPIIKSLGRTLFYHTGSIAFGALIIAIIQMIRVGLEYLDAKLKGSENAVAKFFLKCLKCCFYCLEKFMKMINKNAYILIAIYGKNFCTSAKDAFFLIMRNIIRVAVVDKVTDFLLFISKLVVVGILTVLSFYFFNGTLAKHLTFLQQFEVELNFFFVPVIVIGISTYVIASIFFSVYGMAVDTLFLCFLEDLERNDGSEEKPYYMNKELKEVLGKKNVKAEKED